MKSLRLSASFVFVLLLNCFFINCSELKVSSSIVSSSMFEAGEQAAGTAPTPVESYCLPARQSGIFEGTNYLQFNPSGSKWQSLASWRVEFRLHDFGKIARTQGIFGNNNGDAHCQIPTSSTLLRCRTYRGTDKSLDIDISGRTDIRVRFQRDEALGKITLEIWNADGSGYVSDQISYVPGAYDGRQPNYVGSIWGTGSEAKGSIAFLRWYGSTVPLKMSAPSDFVSVPADLLNLELDSNVKDTSPSLFGMGISGNTPGYKCTPLFPPSPSLPMQIIEAGKTLVLDATSSSNLTDDQPLKYFWSCASSPASCEWEMRNGPSARLRTSVGGTYTVRLEVVDSLGKSQALDVQMGAVVTDASDRVIFPSTELNKVLGPMLRSGTSPWTWFDQTELKIADALIAAMPQKAGGMPALGGTVSVTPGSATLSGAGTAFQSTFKCNGSDLIVLHYPLSGGGTGRRAYGVSSCQSDTQLTMSQAYDAGTTSASGVSFGKLTVEESAQWVNGSNNWNYYDAVVAFYRLYYRTGITKYRDAARSLADKWWSFPIDGGRGSVSGARSVALFGLILRAVDGKPEYWPGIVQTAQFYYEFMLKGYYPYQPNMDIGDIREQGYVSLWTILIAILHPDPAERTAWLQKAQAAFGYWAANQRANGGWNFRLGPQQNYFGLGNFPWQGAFVANYFVLLHRQTGDAKVLSVLKKYADYMIAEGIDSSNDGGFYEDSGFTFCPDYGSERAGTVTAVAGSSNITGSNTQFQSHYNCNGSDTIIIQDATGMRKSFTVNSCASQTSLTLAGGYSGAPGSGLRILRYPGTGVTPPSTCHVSYGVSAEAKQASRTLLNASHGYIGYLYAMGQGAIYKQVGDRIFAQNLGLGGPGNDGVVGHYGDVISGGVSPLYLAKIYLSKEFAFVGGAAGAQNYLGWRLGPSP